MSEKRRSFVVIKRPMPYRRTTNQETCEDSLMELECASSADKTRHQTSTQLLRNIMDDIDTVYNSQPKKKLKVYKNRQTEVDSGCNCKKTRCLKLYCDCFASGGYCRYGCSCVDCCNNKYAEELRAETILYILSREPRAFSQKQRKASNETRGCNCKKSECLKKYCECYNTGNECSESCRCYPCKNIKGLVAQVWDNSRLSG